MTPAALRTICVFCASSETVEPAYLEAARELGRLLAESRLTLVYGGGSSGLMGRLAGGALEAGGRVVGVMPRFMRELEWAHPALSELRVVEDMHQRKRSMLEAADAVIALPGGSGTFDELFEAITWKRLGLFLNPIVLVNTRGFFDPCLELLERCVREGFMDQRHRAMWSVAKAPAGALESARRAQPWDAGARRFAVPGLVRSGDGPSC